MVREIHTFRKGDHLILKEHGVPAPGSLPVPLNAEIQYIHVDGMYAVVLYNGSRHYIKAWTKAEHQGLL